MARITLDDGKTYKVVMPDKDFRHLIDKGADCVCAELEEIYEQDDYLTVAEIAKLEHDYDIVCHLQEAMRTCPWDKEKNHRIDGTIYRSYRPSKRRKQLEGDVYD